MRRAELAIAILAVAALGLSGCMKIYPDPELPDVDIEWFEGDCAQDTGNVSIVMTGVDDPTEHHELTVPCTVAKTTIKDVSRQRFHVVGQLLDTSGELLSAGEYDVDLRNGFNETAFLYFGGFDSFRITWVFDMGATCESLHADSVMILLSTNGEAFSSNEAPCDLRAISGMAGRGTYSVMGYAINYANETIVAASQQPIEPIVITPGVVVDIGTIVLTPCGSSCPEP